MTGLVSAKETFPSSIRRRSGGGSTLAMDDTDEGLDVTSEGQSWPEIARSTSFTIEEAQAGLVDLARQLAVLALNAKDCGDRTSSLIPHLQVIARRATVKLATLTN